MVTSPYEWKIIKNKTKQTKLYTRYKSFTIELYLATQKITHFEDFFQSAVNAPLKIVLKVR